MAAGAVRHRRREWKKTGMADCHRWADCPPAASQGFRSLRAPSLGSLAPRTNRTGRRRMERSVARSWSRRDRDCCSFRESGRRSVAASRRTDQNSRRRSAVACTSSSAAQPGPSSFVESRPVVPWSRRPEPTALPGSACKSSGNSRLVAGGSWLPKQIPPEGLGQSESSGPRAVRFGRLLAWPW